MSTDKIGVIGAGKIGAAIARGIIRAGLASKENVMASDVSDALRDSIVQDLGIKATPDNTELCAFADVVILAVKPQIVDPVAHEIAKRLGKTKLLISVAAGVPLRRIETHLEPGARV
ncbi:MAG TPA: NAD(P)-binding domain-containing protein, partial [Candidatus Binatia bacterium]|nr:NAD(P)-binding domain-containing protein [Candidatus Binatia bacterium]